MIAPDSQVVGSPSSLTSYALYSNPVNVDYHIDKVLTELDDLLADLLTVPKVDSGDNLSLLDVRAIIAERLSTRFQLPINGLSFVNVQFSPTKSTLSTEESPGSLDMELPVELTEEIGRGRTSRKTAFRQFNAEGESVPAIIARLMSLETNHEYQAGLFQQVISFIHSHVDQYLIEHIMCTEMDNENQRYEIDEVSILGRLQRSMMKTLGALSMIGPLRAAPRRFYTESEFKELIFGADSGYDFSDEELGQIAAGVSSNLNALGADYQVGVEIITQAKYIPNLYALTLTDNLHGVTQSYQDVGFGLSQIIPILIKLRTSEHLSFSDPFIIIEQPELHLHPRSQARLANLFTDWLKSTPPEENWKQLLLETHSEHLVRGFQVQVAKGQLSPDDVAIYYVDKNAEGNSFVKLMPLDEYGSFIEPWPEGFFDQAYLQALELLSAQE